MFLFYEDVITHFSEISLFVLCSCVRKGSIGDEVHLKLRTFKELEVEHKVHSHLLHTVRNTHMRDVQE